MSHKVHLADVQVDGAELADLCQRASFLKDIRPKKVNLTRRNHITYNKKAAAH
jgi:hypothetical protein